jgi:hypothetical protein
MLGSHWLAYLLAAPGSHARAELLDTTGHGYWPLASTFGVAALVIGLVSFVATRFRARTPGPLGRNRLFVTSLLALLALQVGGFTALEVIERVLAGHSVGLANLLEPTMVIGVVIQVLAALVAAVVLTAIAAVVDLIAYGTRRPQTTPAPLTKLASLIAAPRLLPATGASSLRGPPAIS